jgi:hypothetical protein
MPGETQKTILPHPRSAQYGRRAKSKSISESSRVNGISIAWNGWQLSASLQKNMKSTIARLFSSLRLTPIICAWISLLAGQAAFAASNTLSLAGQWTYRFDSEDRGLAAGWTNQLPGEGQVELPGTTDTRGIGPVNSEMTELHLSRSHKYRGAVWYEREIEIPKSWAGRAVMLELERVQWESRLWINGQPAGMRDSLSAPHRYDLTGSLTPGKHRVTLRIDNRIKYLIHHSKGTWQFTHAITDETQGNWNGVIGRMELRASPLVSIDHVQVATATNAVACVIVRVNNRTGQPAQVSLSGKVQPGGGRAAERIASAAPGISTHEVEVPLRSDAARWDEFSPVLQTLKVKLAAPKQAPDERSAQFGILDFKAGRRQFELNGRPIFLRGNLENAQWPLTGHPPMLPENGWRQLMAALKEHGMNHLRFHSWCPPEAAFTAADEMGIIFQVELPLWDGCGDIGSDAARCVWLPGEARRILDAYGNHPSFRLFSMGNELAGNKDDVWLMNLVRDLQKTDPRILYTCTTHPIFASSSADYFSAAGTPLGIVRGADAGPSGRPAFGKNFSKNATPVDRPLIAHEIGQFSMFFNPAETGKYTGSMKPRNYEMFRAAMEKHQLLDMAEPFRQSSARFHLSLYKRELEQMLATPELAGYQALGIQDYSGQGTTMCGFLDTFWESKGILPASAWRRFCAPTVVLARFLDAVLTEADTFEAKVEVSHFGPKDLKSAVVRWELRDGNRVAASGVFPPTNLVTGKLTIVGAIKQPLAGFVRAPARLDLQMRLENSEVANNWPLRVYPAPPISLTPPAAALVTNRWNETCKQALAAGRDVILLPDPQSLVKCIPTRWMPVFWNMLLFRDQTSTIGIHLDPANALFAQFPTESHSDAQWAKLTDGAAGGVDLTGTVIRPLVWLIDDFHADFQRKLGAVFEAKVGRGRLLVATLNLAPENQQWPEVRQFLASLYAYAGSSRFNPAETLTPQTLDTLLAARALAAGSDHPPEGLENAVLRVAAAAQAAMGSSPADKKLDKIILNRGGFDYQVAYDTAWKDRECSAWVGHTITLRVTVPEALMGIRGRLAVRFTDWNKQGRDGHLFFNGHDQSLIGPHEAGRWVIFDLDGKSRDYTLKVDRTRGVNLMMTDIAVMGP